MSDSEQEKQADDNPGAQPGISAPLDILVEEHEEEVSENGKPVRRQGIYLLPNLFTTGGLFAGFYAVIAAMRGDFESAPIAILAALVLDGLDGRIARMTNTQSKFGAEFDSLADMVSFGVAPALVMFSFALHELGKFGWSAAFIYVACAALRLARFNTQIDTAGRHFDIHVDLVPRNGTQGSHPSMTRITQVGHSIRWRKLSIVSKPGQ